LFGFATAAIARGPQGSAFGRGGEGGVITLTSAEPGAQAGGEVRAGFGSFQARSAAVIARSARRPAADATAAAAGSERHGFITNTTLGRPVDDQRTLAATARVRFRPTTASEFTFQFLGSRHRDGAQPLVPVEGPRFTVARGRDGSTRIDFGGGALKGAFDTGLGRLSATTSYTAWSLDPYDNRLVLPPTLDSRISQTQRTWNEELRLASDPRSTTPWRLGGWWSRTQTHGEANRDLVLGPTSGIPLEVSRYALETRSRAVFGEAIFAPLAGWRITPAFRAETTSQTFDRSQRAPGSGQFQGAKSAGEFLPKISAHHTLGEATTFSVSLGRGAKPGGWSAYTGNAALAPFEAEHVTAFEAGFDTALARKTVRLAARIFAYGIDQLQIERSFNASDYLVVNAPRARSRGGELELNWRPVAELTLAATAGVTEVRLREFTDPFTRRSFAGNRAPYAPDYDAHVSAIWRGHGGWFAAGEVAATGRTYFDEAQSPVGASPAHATVGARLGYETPRWRLAVYGENLRNEAYAALIIPGVRHLSPGAPRMYGFEAVKKW
jgi:iron complex outermembrane receptor protein